MNTAPTMNARLLTGVLRLTVLACAGFACLGVQPAQAWWRYGPGYGGPGYGWGGGYRGGIYLGFPAPQIYAPPVYVAPPYYPPAYYPAPVYPPPVYAAPAAAQGCYAGPYTCPLDEPVAVGGPCSCPANNGRIYGRAG